MRVLNTEHFVEKEFSPELAGERVGWVNVQTVGEDRRGVLFNAAVATVGEKGALAAKDVTHFEGMSPFTKTIYDGFEDVQGIEITLDRETGQEVNLNIVNPGRHSYIPISPEYILRGRGLEDEGSKVWAESPEEFLAITKSDLDLVGALDLYPQVYYGINGSIGHESFNLGLSDGEDHNIRKLFFADPEMSTETIRQIDVAGYIGAVLEIVDSIDLKTEQDLLSGDVAPEKLLEDFENARVSVGEHERAVADIARSSLFGRFLNLPIDFRPNGRVWPYIDPMVEDPSGSFGRVVDLIGLSELKPVIDEIRDERRELETRRRFALVGEVALHELSAAESACKDPVKK